MTLILTLISSLCLNALAEDRYAAHVRGKIYMINDIYIYIYIILHDNYVLIDFDN